jgi:hypothetical protein
LSAAQKLYLEMFGNSDGSYQLKVGYLGDFVKPVSTLAIRKIYIYTIFDTEKKFDFIGVDMQMLVF